MKSMRKLMKKIRLREAIIKRTKGQIAQYAYTIKRKLSTPAAKKIAGAALVLGLIGGLFARKKIRANRLLVEKNARIAKKPRRSILSTVVDGVALVSSISALASLLGGLGGRGPSGRRISRH